MAKVYIGNKNCKMFLGNRKIKKAYIGDTKVYSAGNICTYQIGAGITYQEEIDDGISCLKPETFTPSLSGWTFLGWRTDQTASGNVLNNLIMGDDPITLYAVFRQAVVLTKIINKSTTTATGYRYYNNGNVANAAFSISNPSVSGATFLGWSTSTSASVTYAAGTKSITLSGNTTIRSVFKYNDVTYNIPNADGHPYVCSNGGDWIGPGTSNWIGSPTINISIDCSKYSGIKSTDCTARIKINFEHRLISWTASAGGSTVTILSWYENDGSDSGVRNAPYTINFSKTSGTTNMKFDLSGDSSTGDVWLYSHNVTAIGRTVVG